MPILGCSIRREDECRVRLREELAARGLGSRLRRVGKGVADVGDMGVDARFEQGKGPKRVRSCRRHHGRCGQRHERPRLHLLIRHPRRVDTRAGERTDPVDVRLQDPICPVFAKLLAQERRCSDRHGLNGRLLAKRRDVGRNKKR